MYSNLAPYSSDKELLSKLIKDNPFQEKKKNENQIYTKEDINEKINLLKNKYK